MTQTSMITVDLGTLGPVAFDTLAAQVHATLGYAEKQVDDAADSLHRANGERPIGGRSPWYRNTLETTIAEIETSPTRLWKGRPGKTVIAALDAYREKVAARDGLRVDFEALQAEYDSRPWPRYVMTRGSGAHIHRDTRCSTCNRGAQRTEFNWLVELSGTPIDEAVKTFTVTMCTVCYPDAPVVNVAPTGCQGTTVPGSTKVDRGGGRLSSTVRYSGDCSCGAKRIRIKEDGTPAKHKPAVTSPFSEGARVTHPGDPGRVWVVQEVVIAGQLVKLAVTDEDKPDANRVYLAADCSAAPAVEAVPMRAQLEQQHAAQDEPAAPVNQVAVIFDDPKRYPESTGASYTLHAAGCADVTRARARNARGVSTYPDARAARESLAAQQLGDLDAAPCLGKAGIADVAVGGGHIGTVAPAAVEAPALCGVPSGFAGARHDFEIRETDAPTTLTRCDRPAGDPIHASRPATLVPEFAPFDEIEHPSRPGVVLVVDHVTQAGRVVAHPAGDLDQTARYLAAKCRLLRSADQVYAGMTVEEKTADLMAVALRATLTHAKGDLDRLRHLVGRYGITVKGGGHVHDSTGYNITQGMPDLARMLDGNRSLALRTVRAGEPAPGTWAALAAQAEREQDNPRVTLPCGLSGRVGIVRTVAATERYCVTLYGYGVGDITGGTDFVDAGAQALEDIDRMLRGNVRFVRTLEQRQTEHQRLGHSDSPNDLGRDAWLATIPVHLERSYGEGPVWCPDETPARVVMVRADATCRECEQAIAFEQLTRGVKSDQVEGRPVRDADGLVVDTTGMDVTVDLRLFFAGRVRGACGHYLAASERAAGLRNCERCGEQVDDDQDDDQDETPTSRVVARYSRQSYTLAIGPEGTRYEDLQWLDAGGPEERDRALFGAGWVRVTDWSPFGIGSTSDAVVRPIEAGDGIGQLADVVEGTAPAGPPAATFGEQRRAYEAGEVVDQGGGWVWRADGKGGWVSIDGGTDVSELRVQGSEPAGPPVPSIRESILPTVIAQHREALRHMLLADGFVPGSAPGTDFPTLVHPAGVIVTVDEGGTVIQYPDANIADGEYGEGIGHVPILFGATYGALRDVAVGLVAVAGGTAPEVTASAAQVEHLLNLVLEYGKAAALGGDTRRGMDLQARSKQEAGGRFEDVRRALLELVGGESVVGTSVIPGWPENGCPRVGCERFHSGIPHVHDQGDAAQVARMLALVESYGDMRVAAAESTGGLEARTEARRAATEQLGQVRAALLALGEPATTPAGGQHVTRILERDGAGHWSWECDARDGDESGYESADEVLAAAAAHGPLAADSLQPVDDVEALIIPGEGGVVGGSIGSTGAQLEIDGVLYPIPDRVPTGGIIASHRILAALAAAGYRTAAGYFESLTGRGIRVVEGLSDAQDVDGCGAMTDHGGKSVELLRATDGALYVDLSGGWTLAGYRPLFGVDVNDWREAQLVAAQEITDIRSREVTGWAHHHDQGGHVWVAVVAEADGDVEAAAAVRRRVVDFLAGHGPASYDQVAAHLDESDQTLVFETGMTLRKILTAMYAAGEICSTHASDYLGAAFCPVGVPCDDCETGGKNCLAHKTYEQRVRDGW